jgi:glycosyltransferase involved in cell wall biosynthesis
MIPEPRVSIIVPTYRRPDLLERAIASVTGQTLSSWELLVIDDNDPASHERRETEAVVQRFAAEARLRYIRHDQNRGGGAARNTGLRAARAPFTAFLDDDDEWHTAKLERQLTRIEKDAETALVYCRVRVVHVASGRESLTPTDGRSHGVRDLLRRNTIGTTSCILCRTDALRAIGGFDEALPARQDQDLYIRLAERYAVAFVDEVLVTLYVHGRASISSTYENAIRAHELFVDKYRTMIDADPEALRAIRHQLGKHLIAARRYPAARSVLWLAVRSAPFDLDVWLRLAMTFALPRALLEPAKRVRTALSRRS